MKLQRGTIAGQTAAFAVIDSLFGSARDAHMYKAGAHEISRADKRIN